MPPDSDYKLAGELRPSHVVSLTGFESDAAIVTEVQPSVDYSEVEITLETGLTKKLAIDFPLVVYSE